MIASRACLLAVAMVFSATTGPALADAPRALKWADLVPPAAITARPPKTFFSGATPLSQMSPPSVGGSGFNGGNAPGTGANDPLPAYGGEGAWMSRPKHRTGQPPAVVQALDGAKVTIGGYVVPLDFESTKVSEFLLVPFVGACIHVPPPPANQIVYVKTSTPIELKGQFDPVWVTGTMKTETSFTGLADAGYTLSAETVAPRKP